MAEEETIGDVLSRTGALNKDDMTAEVESYGLEVDPSWTKAEIMDHFEEFLTSPEETYPDPVVEEAPQPEEAPPTVEGDAALFAPQQQEQAAPQLPRCLRSRTCVSHPAPAGVTLQTPRLPEPPTTTRRKRDNMARKTKTTTDVDEYDENGDLVEYDQDQDVQEITPGTETLTATDPSGDPVDIAVSPWHVSDMIAEQKGGVVEPDEDVDFPGKEEDAELARQQHELGHRQPTHRPQRLITETSFSYASMI